MDSWTRVVPWKCEKCLASGYTLKIEPIEFNDELDTRRERKNITAVIFI